MLEEPDGRSNWIRRLDGTLLTDDNSGVYGEEWGLTVGGGWPLDELHGGTRDSTDALMHFGARHMLVEDGRWLQPEPLLYMGVTNGDLTNPLGYGPVYARGNSNLYGDPTGNFGETLKLGLSPEVAAAANALAQAATKGTVAGVVGGSAVLGFKTGYSEGRAMVAGSPMLQQVESTNKALVASVGDAAAGLIFSADGADDGASDDASQGGVANPARENKKRHIFGKPEHGLNDVVEELGGEEEALAAIEGAVQGAAEAGEIDDVFETEVEVGSATVTVRGRVVDGEAKVGTAFIPEAGN